MFPLIVFCELGRILFVVLRRLEVLQTICKCSPDF